MRIGTVQTLTCDRNDGSAAQLRDDDGQIAVMPGSESLPAAGEQLEVFVYTGSQGEPLATRSLPHVQRGGCATLKVVAEGSGGVFLDWGLDKHLLLPFAEQRRPLKIGQNESILVYLDNSNRLAATSRLDHHLEERPAGFKAWQQVDLLIYQRTDLGYKAVVDDRAVGLIYASDVFRDVRPGLRTEGWVKRLREDGRLDLALQPPARDLIDPLSQRILDWLSANDGVGHLTDHSSPDAIRAEFQVSKKNYKRALSQLYKQRLIRIEADRITLCAADDDTVGEILFPEPR